MYASMQRPLTMRQQAAHCSKLEHHGHRRLRVLAAVADAAVAKPFSSMPEPLKGLPWLGPVDKIKLDQIFVATRKAFRESGAQIMQTELYGITAVYIRNPDDFATVVKNPTRFVKDDTGLENVHEWLGNGLVTDLDADHHGAMKELLLPAFRALSVKDLVPLFVQVGQQMAAIMLQRGSQPQDVQELSRRATLDVIGKAGFGYDFQSLALAEAATSSSSNGSNQQQQQQQHAGGAASSSQQVLRDPVAILDGLTMPAMYLTFKLPLPRWAVPGIRGYDQGIKELEQVVADMLQERRSHGIQPGDRSLLAFMLRHQQQQGETGGSSAGIQVTDRDIRDQLMTFMFAGSDTTASTLGFLMYELARNPAAQQRAAAEVEAALSGVEPGSWTPDLFQGMPFLAACASETLRLYPAAPQLARMTAGDEVLGGYQVPKGTILLPDVYNLHRNEAFWPRPEEFLPERWLPEAAKQLGASTPDAFLPFSTGPRACIGRYFALLELQVLAAVVLKRLQLTEVPGHTVDPIQSFTMAARDNILVSVSPR